MSKSKLASVFFLCVIAACSALPAKEEARSNSIQTENDLLDSIYTDCLRKDSMSCLKYKIFNFVDKALSQKDSITVTEGVQIVKTGDRDGAPRSINSDDTIESLLLRRVADFLETHTVKVDLKGSDIVDTARSLGDVEEGRGKKKKGGNKMGAIMALVGLKGALLAKLALAAIALIAGKALLIGKIALVLSAIIGLKKLLGGGHGKHVTYEVVPHAQHSSSHVASHETVSGHGGGYEVGGGYGAGGAAGGWGRSIDAQTLAYRGQAPQQA